MSDLEKTSPEAPPVARWMWAALGICGLVHFAVLGRKGLSNNEFITLRAIRLPWGEMIDQRISFNHMPGYFLMLKAWTGAAGLSEWALRLPSTLFSMGAVGATWALARRAWGPRPAMVAAFAAVLSQGLLSLSADARMYSGVVFWTCLSMASYLAVLETCGARARAVYLAAGLGGVFFHLLFAMVYAVQAAHFLLVRRRAARGAAPWLAGLALAPFAFFAPWLLAWNEKQYKVGRDAWDMPSLGRPMREVLRALWGDYDFGFFEGASRVVGLPLMVVTLAGVLWLAFRALRRLRGAEEPAPSLAGELADSLPALWVFVPVALVFLAATRSSSVLGSQRYYSVAAAGLPLAVAGVWRAIGPAGARRAYLWGALGLLTYHSAGWIAHPGSGLREAVRHVASRAGPGDALALCGASSALEAFSYYGLEHPAPAFILSRNRGELAGSAWHAELRKRAAEAAEGKDRLWLVLYHDRKNPLPKALSAPESPFELAPRSGSEGEDFLPLGDCKLYLFRRKNGTSQEVRGRAP